MSERNAKSKPKQKRKAAAKKNASGSAEKAKGSQQQKQFAQWLGGSATAPPVRAKFGGGGNPEYHTSSLAGKIVQQMLDPCSAPLTLLPDRWQGQVELLRAPSLFNITMTAAGSASTAGRFAFVSTGPTAKIDISGASTFTTYVSANDDQLQVCTDSYKHMRLVAMCVTIRKTSAFDTANGNCYVGCFPIDTSATFVPPASIAAARALMLQNGAQSIDISEGAEITWCPRTADDFTPYVPTSTYTTASDIQSMRLTQRPTLNFFFDNCALTTSVQLSVTSIYEGWLLPAQASRGVPSAHQNTVAVEQAISSTHQLCLIRRGGLADRTAGYAANVAGVLAGKGWEAIANHLIAKVRC